MFLEKCGQFFFSRMRPAFFFVMAAFPVMAAAFFLYLESTELYDLEERFSKLSRKEKIAFERKGRKERFLKRHSHANPYFLDHEIEGFPLLQSEKTRLESLLSHPAFPESQSLKSRLAFLNENRFAFTEENIRVSNTMKEVDEKQRKSVQMDENDLKKILSITEDLPIDSELPPTGSPQLIIKEFRLKKQETSLQTEVFEVEMDLLKREFIKS
jgi:hypothetical protein